MSQSNKSPWDILDSGQPQEVKELRQELADLDFELKKTLDAGLTVEEYPVISALKSASEAAIDIVDKGQK
ncbi:MAG: EscE/YscE/SsaE family type III secretion system needle protein co-chaperone [Deltaproteobacteria bacterium]|jgi:hypothetical protein|nr:EscE/YscE/SsaE family type III secretion system needle protein co-chaperone [Deltaproteobacteria bacterium]